MTDSLTYTVCEKLEIEICRTLYCIYMRQICIIPPVYTDFIHWIYTSCRLHIYSGRIAHLYRTGCICISDGLHIYIGQVAYVYRTDCMSISDRLHILFGQIACSLVAECRLFRIIRVVCIFILHCLIRGYGISLAYFGRHVSLYLKNGFSQD